MRPPSFASLNLFWLALVAASLCRGAFGNRLPDTATQRRGYNIAIRVD